MKGKSPRAGLVSIFDVRLAIHPIARAAWDAWNSVPSVQPETVLAPDVLAAMLAQTAIVAMQAEATTWRVVAGFESFRLLGALETLGHRPKRALITFVPDKADAIRLALDGEIARLMLRYPARQYGAAYAQLARMASDETTQALLGRGRANLEVLEAVTKLHRRNLVGRRRIKSWSESSILAEILAEAD
jgi:hypothetical protein